MGVTTNYTDNSAKFIEAIHAAVNKALESCGQTAEGYAKKACPAPTGNLRNSISHTVDTGDNVCYVGSNSEYAAYVELGTGVYYPGGRKTPWVYKDGKGNWHMTNGQRAQPYLKPAVADHTGTYKTLIENAIKNG